MEKWRNLHIWQDNGLILLKFGKGVILDSKSKTNNKIPIWRRFNVKMTQR